MDLTDFHARHPVHEPSHARRHGVDAISRSIGNDGKPWRYLLIPHDAIADDMTLDGMARQFTVAAPEEGSR